MALRIEDLKPTPGSRTKSIRVGRGPGSGIGKTSGRGMNGQGKRGRGKVRIGFEGGQTTIYRRTPMIGFTNAKFRVTFAEVNLLTLEAKFESNKEVTIEKLVERNILKDLKDGVKILGKGELTKPLVVKANAFSESAKQKIEAAGGKVEVIK
ncbi:MAG TPA: 50S ribosomal protein L15 [Petrotogaceae bacterium]|nr:50S ribosomal protein L15 [Petrotogaceae bacterium]